MRVVCCHECGKRYDFDADDFCPKCGAFTLPGRDRRIGADGSVERLDGISERNHQKSFVHAEFHEENRERRGTPLEQGIRRPAARRPAVNRSQPAAKRSSKPVQKSPAAVLKWIVLAIVGLQLLGGILPALFF